MDAGQKAGILFFGRLCRCPPLFPYPLGLSISTAVYNAGTTVRPWRLSPKPNRFTNT